MGIRKNCTVFESSVRLFLASVSNGSPPTLRSPHREDQSSTEEYMGKARTHRAHTHTYYMTGYWAGYLCEGVCV